MSLQIESISIIGAGNVAHHLGKAFVGHVKVNSIYSRNTASASELAHDLNAYHAHSIHELIPSDLLLVCVNDDEIVNVINKIPIDQPVAYTSGSVGLSDLPDIENIGVIYPLQTFSKNREVNLFEVPFFIEANNEIFSQSLFDLAWLLSRKVVYANSTDRKNLHVAAVIVNNFANHLSFLAQAFLKKNSLEFDFLKPLILETAKKIQNTSPFDAQTGPAMRGDDKTIEAHLRLLEDETRDIYKILSDSIQHNYKL